MSAQTLNQTSDEQLQSIASIHIENIGDVKPLREFLESFGCTVVVNEILKHNLDYCIICGDPDFVKSIFSKHKINAVKSIALLFNTQSQDVEDIQNNFTKVAVIPKPPFTDQIVRSIFAFFFTPGDSFLALDKYVQTRSNPEQIIKPEQTMVEVQQDIPVPKESVYSRAKDRDTQDVITALDDSDKTRISKTISEVFGNASQTLPVKTKRKRKKKIKIQLLIFLFCCAILAPVVWYVFSLACAFGALTVSGIQLSEGNTRVSRQGIVLSSYWTTQAKGALTFYAVPIKLVLSENYLRQQERVISFVTDTTSALSSTLDIVSEGKEFSKTLASQVTGSQGATLSPAKLVSLLKVQLPFVHDRLGLATAELAYITKEQSFPFSLPILASKTKTIQQALDSARKNITVVEQLLTIYGQTGGFSGKKTYLLLLQNSMELRPTGGFIGSVAKVVFREGLIESLEIQDVYTIDGQLKGHTDPPRQIRETVGQEHWYLRDSNWNPDFSVSGSVAGWFYEKETNTSVDGVIAISTPFLIDLLRATGPIDLPDYNDRITADNFFGKSLYYVQHDFFPGSTQKKDFLGNLTQALLTHILNSQSVNSVGLLRAVGNALERHDIMMYFSDASLQMLVSQYGWSGQGITRNTCRITGATPCVGDFLQIVEANLSVNKANAFVTRKRSTETIIGESGNVVTTVNIVFTNNSELKGSDGGGNYKNYMRFLTPAGSQVTSLMLDGKSVPIRNETVKQIPDAPYMEAASQQIEADGSILTQAGILFDVPQKQTRSVNFTYTHDIKVPESGQTVMFELNQPKQPGIASTELETRIRFPGDWRLVSQTRDVKTDLLANTTQLTYNSLLSQDEIIRILVTKP